MQQLQGYGSPSGDANFSSHSSLATELLPGTFGIRALAWFLDSLIHTVIAAAVGATGGLLVALLGSAGLASAGWQERLGAASWLTYTCSFAGGIVYHAIGSAYGGSTLGKLACGLRVLREDGGPCTLMKGLGRSVAFYLDAQLFGFIGWTSMSKSRMLQRYGDRWAGTIVVNARQSTGLPRAGSATGIALGIVAYGIIVLAGLLAKTL